MGTRLEPHAPWTMDKP